MMRTEDAPAAAVSATAMAAVRATRCMRNLRSRYFTPAGLPYIKARMRRTSVFFAVLLALVCARSSLQGQGASAPLTGPKGLDFDTFRTKVQPIFLATRGEHARCYACHSQGTPLRLQELSPGALSPARRQRVGESAVPVARAGGAGQAGGAGRQAGPPPASSWHAEPAKVFDNLYFVGMTEYSAWALTTSQGIILLDAIFDYSVEDEVVNGLKTLGLNPADIKYVLVSHAHTDHIGGAKYLQEHFNARVVMSKEDWDFADRTIPERIRPKRDIEAKDGDTLTLGDTTITMHLTPGHTPGTVSSIYKVTDHGKPHTVATWGGTTLQGNIVDAARPYIASAARSRDRVKNPRA